MTLPVDAPRILMLELAERAVAGTDVRSTRGISSAAVAEPDDPSKDPWRVMTEGKNFEGVWALDEYIDVNRCAPSSI